MEATVKRKVLLNGSLEEYEDVSVDFYVPQPRIERHHLVQAENPSDSTNQDGNSSSGSNSANPDSSGSDNTSKNPSNSESNTTGTGTSSGKPSGNSNASEGSASGKEDDKIIYDKGGNIIKFDESGNPID